MRVIRLIMVVVFAGFCRDALAAPGDWPEPRQNSRLTGVQPTPGAMKVAPVRLAGYDLGRSVPDVTAARMSDGRDVGLAIVAGALHCYDTSGNALWTSHPRGINFTAISRVDDLDGDGTREVLMMCGRPTAPFGAALLLSLETGEELWRYDVEPMSYAWYIHTGDYIPESPSEEIVVIMHAYPPDKDNGYITLFEFPSHEATPGQGAAPMARWRYDFDAYTCFPSFLQTDVDGDGLEELVVETHSRMWILDARTGAKRDFYQWDVSPANVRSYGLVEFVDLDGDSREDFLCIANFAQHHEVLLNQSGKFVEAWHYGWDESVTTGKVATTWPLPPYADVDGDGKLELTVSMFNSENEGRWLVRVYDAVTGEIKYRMPGMIAAAMRDLDGDGAFEITANATEDPTVALRNGGNRKEDATAAHILKVKDGKLESVWQEAGAAALRREKSDRPVIRRDKTLYVATLNADGTLTEEEWQAPPPDPGPDFSAIPSVSGAGISSVLAADVDHDDVNELILYRTPKVEVLELVDGKLEAVKEFTSDSEPVLVDLDGDGRIEIVTSAVNTDGPPAVTAHRWEGEPLWLVQLPAPDRAGLPFSRQPYIRAGRFTGKSTPDLYLLACAPIVRSVVLDGLTGAPVWEKNEFEGIERYYGPTTDLASVYDFDGDGCEDLVFTNPDYYCVADGPTGEMLLGPLYPPEIFSQPSQGLYTLPAILEASDTEPTVALVAGHYFQAAMSLHAAPYWYKLPTAGESPGAAEGFLRTPDGVWLMGFGRQNGQFACVSVADGTVRREFPVEATTTDVAAGDVDGDGTFEFVFGTSHGDLYALGDDSGKPRELWRAELSGGMQAAPILADMNGDGKIEIVAATVDGWLGVYGAGSE